MKPSSPALPCRPVLGPSLQASKWQTCPALIDAEEMKSLLDALGDFWIVQISGLVPTGHEIIKRQEFLEVYAQYIEGLKKGNLSFESRMRPYFSSVWTLDLETLYTVKAKEGHSLVKVLKPVVQLQIHQFDYSLADGKFRSMVLGSDCVQWGLQFSFPHLYQDENCHVYTVREGEQFPNAALFKRLQGWIRAKTIATPIEVEGKKVNVPIRLGKQCLSWINRHPQLKTKGLYVRFEKNG